MCRSMLRDLPLKDRAGRVRRQGSVVMVNVEALAQSKEEKTSADAAMARISANPPSGKSGKTRVYLRNRLLRRDKERETRACIRERRFVTSLLETLVSPMSGGTKSCRGVTPSALQGWRSIGLKRQSLMRREAVECLESHKLS